MFDDDDYGYGDAGKKAALFSSLILGTTALLLSGMVIANAVSDAIYDSKWQQIDQNIVENNELSKFTSSAYQVSKTESEYFVELFGTAIKTPGSAPRFTSLTYHVDQAFYDKSNKVLDIEFEHDSNGQIVNAENTGGLEAAFSYSDLLEKLIKVTEQRALSVNEIGTTTSFESQTNSLTNSKLGILSVTKPVIDEKKNTISFVINTISDIKQTDADNGQFNLKAYTVTQTLNDELKKNSNLVYEQYLEGKADFQMTKKEKVTIDNNAFVQIQNKFGLKPVASKNAEMTL